jgi:hypothetical protein
MNTKKNYRMTILKQLNYIWISLLFFLLAPVIYGYSLIEGFDNSSLIIALIIWIAFGLLYFNGFRLHFSYYQIDKHKRLVIDGLENISIIDNNGTYSFALDQIVSITNIHSGLNNRTPWNDYNFSIFKLKNGQEMILTCLILDLDDIVDIFPSRLLIKKNYYISTLTKK